jgi:hypothetical protein
MKMSVEQLTKLIKRIVNVIKPNGVEKIHFTLDPISYNEFYMDVTYVVPDNSEFLKLNPFLVDKNSRYFWNSELRKSIKNYFGVDVIINSSAITSTSYYNTIH